MLLIVMLALQSHSLLQPAEKYNHNMLLRVVHCACWLHTWAADDPACVFFHAFHENAAIAEAARGLPGMQMQQQLALGTVQR
jgi:hypothetical protein